MDDFELELKKGFLDEAGQHLDASEQAFLNLDGAQNNPQELGPILDQLFRLAHNLKGTSRAVGFGDIAEFTHELEEYLLKLKNRDLPVTDSSVDLLLECNDYLKTMISGLCHNMESRFDTTDVRGKIHAQILGQTAATSKGQNHKSEKAQKIHSEVEVETSNMIEEEWSTKKKHPPTNAGESKNASADYDSSIDLKAKSEASSSSQDGDHEGRGGGGGGGRQSTVIDETIRVPLSRIEKLNNFVGEMVIMQTVLNQQRFEQNQELINKSIIQMGKITKEVQSISMSLRLLPIRGIFSKMQRIVRDTSKVLGKRVRLHLSGEETEVDKTILELINDPLVHTVRNALDHGLEENAERPALNKSLEGNVWLRAYHESNFLVIEVEDDGRGIDPDRVFKKAVERGLIPASAKLTTEESNQLLFHPGFSTKAEVSEVSGRGVGLDVVKTNIEQLNGLLELSSELGKGSKFKISLPLTLAVIDGMVAMISGERYVVPVSQVHETVQLRKDAIEFVTGGGEVLNLRGEVIPLIRLNQILRRKKNEMSLGHSEIAIINRKGKQAAALLVDDIVRKQQVVIKKLGPEVRIQDGFTGSAIMGDGKPVLILDLHEILTNLSKKQTSNLKTEMRAA